jgi:hypothetical protein
MRLLLLSFKLMLSVVILAGCASTHKMPVEVKTGERSNLAFTGKGAAAGIMMDAYMGGAGVAIGIAIDEGIAKDIATNLAKYPSGFSITSLVEKNLLAESKNQYSIKRDSTKTSRTIAATQIVIDTYGFRTFPGEGDKVTPWLKIRFINNTNNMLLTYPDDFQSPQTLELADAKTNPELTFGQLNNAVQLVVSRWVTSEQH